jgi:hypothetical protein
MFLGKAVCKFKETGRSKYSCNFSILKPEESVFSERPQQFQGLDIVGTHITLGAKDLQTCIVADIKNFHQ